jgi:two-component system cell cycle response regulator
MPARILVVEDNPNNLELMDFLLGAFGHRALLAHDGEEGLEIARRQPVDLVLVDLQMPRMDGFELLRRLRAEPGWRAPLIAVTALAMVGDREKILAAGFDGYVAKPIAPETFVAEVERFLVPERPADAR